MASSLGVHFQRTQSNSTSKSTWIQSCNISQISFIFPCCFLEALSQDSNPFLRISLFNFQVNNNKVVPLSEIKTQIELREKHRSARDHYESKRKSCSNAEEKYFVFSLFVCLFAFFQNRLEWNIRFTMTRANRFRSTPVSGPKLNDKLSSVFIGMN